MNIIHVINDFTIGGAQRMLLKVIQEDNKSLNNHFVVILINRTDEIFFQLKECNITYYFFFNKFNFFSPLQVFKLIISLKPDVIQTWLYTSDLFGVFFKFLSPNSRLIWNVRNGFPDKQNISYISYLSSKLCLIFSSYPEKIICPSHDSIKRHIQFGYPKNKFIYIPNFIGKNYSISTIERYILCQKKSSIIYFGCVSRFDDQKGIDVLIKAINCLPPNLNLKFSFIGTGLNSQNINILMNKLGIFSLQYDIDFKSKTNNMQEFFRNIHFHISTSKSEAFPNSIFESMFFGKPNIATKAGDSEYLISNFGRLVNLNDYEMIAKCIEDYTYLYNNHFDTYISLSLDCFSRINNNFDSIDVLNSYNSVWFNK